jgi:hypothetical protein
MICLFEYHKYTVYSDDPNSYRERHPLACRMLPTPSDSMAATPSALDVPGPDMDRSRTCCSILYEESRSKSGKCVEIPFRTR